jgi:hypothetical protein
MDEVGGFISNYFKEGNDKKSSLSKERGKKEKH